VAEIAMAGLVPHPPIIIPDIGGAEIRRVRRTVDSMGELARQVAAVRPDVVLVISPHSPMLGGYVGIHAGETLVGDFASFGAPQVRVELANDVVLARMIVDETRRGPVRSRLYPPEYSHHLDHGVLVPCYFLTREGLRARFVCMSMAVQPVKALFEFGSRVRRAIERHAGGRVVVIASGDLSHRLSPGAPAGYDPAGEEFDRQLVQALERYDVRAILDLSPRLVERAGECGFRPVVMMLGMLTGLDIDSRVLSYEGPFGVGYAVASLVVTAAADATDGEPSLVDLARDSLETFVREGRIIEPPISLPEAWRARKGCFVSLKKGAQLRGCIGTVTPTRSSLAEEVIHNAIAAGSRDPRFPPVTADELEQLVYTVDVLEEPELVEDATQLDPRRYGVVVRKGPRTGLLLPDLPGVDTVEQQLAIAKRKAGIHPSDEDVQMYRFRVTRFTESGRRR